jgi:adenylate kinase
MATRKALSQLVRLNTFATIKVAGRSLPKTRLYTTSSLPRQLSLPQRAGKYIYKPSRPILKHKQQPPTRLTLTLAMTPTSLQGKIESIHESTLLKRIYRAVEIKDAKLIFNQAWKNIVDHYGVENIHLPREFIFLMGAPG